MLLRPTSDRDTCRDNRTPSGFTREIAGALEREAQTREALAARDQDPGQGELAEHLRKAARDAMRCGFDMVGHKCRDCGTLGHPLPFTCRKSSLCPTCARVDSAQKRDAYGLRVIRARKAAPPKSRLMFSTWALRPYDQESIGDALQRARDSWRVIWGAVYDIPRTRRQWALYWELWPLRPGEVRRHGTPAKARRVRRRGVVADRRVRHCGAIVPHELGPSNMNPHLHALVLGPFVPQKILSRAWLLATGNSSHVYVKQAYGRDNGLRETLKYLTKFDEATPEQIVAAYCQTLRRSARVTVTEEGNERTKVIWRTMRSVECYGSFRSRHSAELDVPELLCLMCGGKMRPYGWIPGQLYRMGINEPPEDFQFSPRGPPRTGRSVAA